MKLTKLIIELSDTLVDPAALDGKTFQVHVIAADRLVLYPVAIEEPDHQCPVLIGGERCGLRAGHEGKHCWANGD